MKWLEPPPEEAGPSLSSLFHSQDNAQLQKSIKSCRRDMQDRDGFGFHHEIPFLASDLVLVWETMPWELSWEQDSCESRDLQERSAAIHRTWQKKILDKLHSAGIHMAKVARVRTQISVSLW